MFKIVLNYALFAEDGAPIAFNFCVRGVEDYVSIYIKKNGGEYDIAVNDNFIEYKKPTIKEDALKEAIELFKKSKEEILNIIKNNFKPKKRYKR